MHSLIAWIDHDERERERMRRILALFHERVLPHRNWDATDPWDILFAKAKAAQSEASDLVPYWLCVGPTKVERRVPMLPYSREVNRLQQLRRSLTVYRLAFGQPRQDDLLEFLEQLASEQSARIRPEQWQIDLRP